MKAIVTGGGTGDHIYPAIAIADELKRRIPDAEILYVGTEHGMEADFVPRAGYPIRFIHSAGFDRKNLLKNVDTAAKMLRGETEAKAILRDFRPDFVIGTGGYVSLPMLRVAQFEHVPTFIHEQNAFAGVANKLVSKGTKTVFVAFEAAKDRFPDAKAVEIVGNPVRAEFVDADREACRKALGLADDVCALLCFGGSLGAMMINKTFSDAIPALLEADKKQKTRIFYATGKMYYDEYRAKLDETGIPYCSLEESLAGDPRPVVLMPYVHRMYEMLPAADLVVSRAGALTVAEITVSGRASIMIPSPNVTENHQYFNAKAVADKGGALLIEEKELTAERLIETIEAVRNRPEERKAMEDAAKAVSIPDSAERIVRSILAQL